ncbi:helix-turn-helix transcriptional regulator [Chloroflexota bacterium]
MAKNEMVCLGLVCSEPCHTYALDKFIDVMGFEQWANISRASIYNTYKRLESQGCVSVTLQKVGNMPERKVYAITEKGKQRLLEELREYMLLPPSIVNNFYLAMFFNFVMSTDEAIEIIEKRIENLNNEIEKLKTGYEESKEWNVHHSMILCNFGLKVMEFDIEAAKEFIKLYRENPDYFSERLPEMYRAMIQSVS